MYNVGDHVVCPGHGVGQITEIEEKELGGELLVFFRIRILTNGMNVMIPTNSKTGVRHLVDLKEIDEVFVLLNDHDVQVDNSTWNRRYREYMQKVKTGSLLEIADVLRSLFLLSESKSLSFGEKKMLDQCKELLVKEIALSGGSEEDAVDHKILGCFPSPS
jgi:CarD family transcriptional regulator